MHYRNGREAKNGDKVIQLDFAQAQVTAVGILQDAVAGNDYCNGTILSTQTQQTLACLCDCIHADDLADLLKKAGLATRPPGK